MKKVALGLILALLLIGAVSLASARVPLAEPPGALRQNDANPLPSIITFTVSLPAITVPAAEAGSTSAILAWHTVGLTDAHRLALHAYRLNLWEPLLGDDHPPLEPVGRLAIIVQHPLNFGPPTYRLSILDNEGRVLDQRVVTVPYDLEAAAGPPTLRDFTADVSRVDADDLVQGTARVLVRWDVANRTPTANLVFEQVMADGRAVVVELPRPNRWVPSTGQGPVAPLMPQGAPTLQLRVRLVDLVDGTTLDERTLEVTIISTFSAATVTPFLPPPTLPPSTPSAAGTAAPQPTIILFTVSPNPVDRGDRVTVQWQVRNASRVTVYRVNPVGQFADFLSDQPEVGSWTLTLPDYHVDTAMFYLAAEGPDGTLAQGSASAQVNCPYTYFFGQPDPPQGCPLGPATDVQAVFQPFERGAMLWRGDTGRIYAFVNPGQVYSFQDTWQEGEAVAVDGQPPAGLLQPVRGFGKVWAENDWLREQLGWATAQEQGYTLRLQQTGAYRYPRAYLTWPDGRVVYIVETTWGFEP